MTRHLVLLVLGLSLVVSEAPTSAQEPVRVPVIGRLAVRAVPNDPVNEAIRRGLRELGYVEGRDFRIEHRSAEGHLDQIPRLAEELVRLKVDVIVTATDESTRAARQATSTIPIVAVLHDPDPVASGFIDSFNRPGGNITGVSSRQSELAGKRLQMLKETLPGVTRVAVLWDLFGRRELEDLKSAAPSLGIQLQLVELKEPYDFDAAFLTARKKRAGAVMVLSSPEFYVNRARLGTLALKNRLPTSASIHEITETGGLMSYGTDVDYKFHRAAYYIDRILKGAKPSDLPFEQTAIIKLVVNLKTAKTLGIAIPQSILVRADEVIR